jgi:hypothetical protein
MKLAERAFSQHLSLDHPSRRNWREAGYNQHLCCTQSKVWFAPRARLQRIGGRSSPEMLTFASAKDRFPLYSRAPDFVAAHFIHTLLEEESNRE